MTTRNVSTIWRRVAWSIAGLNLVLLLVGLPVSISFLVYGDSSLSIVVLVTRILYCPIYTLLAVLIITRQPRHTIGWLFLAVGFFTALGMFVPRVEVSQHFVSSRLVLSLIGLAVELSWIVGYTTPISLVLQFFPDGHLPSQRWWPITAAMLIGIGGWAASLAFHPWPWEARGIYDSHNPVGIAGSEGFFETIYSLSDVLRLIGIGGSLVAVVVRFFRSSGIERTQMKWLVYAAVVIMLPLLLLPPGNPIVATLFGSAPAIFSLAIGIAILRHRLWDIDLIIRRTLIYSALTAILAVIYFGGVVLAQQVFRAVSGQGSDLAIVVSTLLIAALFTPLRRRIQDVIDRRFYRRKYDAEQTLARFNQTLRDEVDIETLKAQLVLVVQETMQPTKIALWLASTERGKETP